MNPLVLVVDDFEDNRALYAEYLAYAGYRVEEASNGREAVERTLDLMPDIVVMDLALPVMDGWEATRRLKTDERTKHIPVIALTGHTLAPHFRDAREAGCDAFLAKPCLPEILAMEVREQLARAVAGLGGEAASEQQRDPRQHDEDDEEHLGRSGRAGSDSREAEDRGDDGHDEEHGSRTQHETLLSVGCDLRGERCSARAYVAGAARASGDAHDG